MLQMCQHLWSLSAIGPKNATLGSECRRPAINTDAFREGPTIATMGLKFGIHPGIPANLRSQTVISWSRRFMQRAVAALVRPFGFELRRPSDYTPDRFHPNHNRSKYDKIGGAVSDRSLAAFLAGNANNTIDLTRFYFLAMVCDLVEKEAIAGDVAELGIYKGNTAFLLTELARRTG